MRAILFFFILLIFTTVDAQDSILTTHNKCWMCGKGQHTNGKPYAFTLKNEIPFIAVGLAISSIALTTDLYNPIKPFTEDELMSLDRNNVNSLDRGATNNWSSSANAASNVLLATASALPALFVSNKHCRSELYPLIAMYGEVLLVNYGVTMLTKNLVNRARPFTYNSEAPLEKRTGSTSKESFISGHTSHTAVSTIFVAKVLSDNHPNMKRGLKIGLWTVALAIPAATAYLRVEAGKHFPTDVMVGYLVGGAIGYFIPHLHKIQAKKSSSPKISLLPIIGFDNAALVMQLQF